MFAEERIISASYCNAMQLKIARLELTGAGKL